jgi:hypothetical protein
MAETTLKPFQLAFKTHYDMVQHETERKKQAHKAKLPLIIEKIGTFIEKHRSEIGATIERYGKIQVFPVECYPDWPGGEFVHQNKEIKTYLLEVHGLTYDGSWLHVAPPSMVEKKDDVQIAIEKTIEALYASKNAECKEELGKLCGVMYNYMKKNIGSIQDCIRNGTRHVCGKGFPTIPDHLLRFAKAMLQDLYKLDLITETGTGKKKLKYELEFPFTQRDSVEWHMYKQEMDQQNAAGELPPPSKVKESNPNDIQEDSKMKPRPSTPRPQIEVTHRKAEIPVTIDENTLRTQESQV